MSSNVPTNSKVVWSKTNRNVVMYVQITDKAGNKSSVVSTNVRQDITPPTVTLSNSSSGSWTNKAVTVTVNAKDTGGSGIASKKYGTSSSSMSSNVPTNSKVVWSRADRNVVMYTQITDNAGNKSSIVNTNIKQDITPPYLSTKYYWKHDYTVNGNLCYIYIYYFKDSLSGVYRMKYGHCYQNYNCSSGSAYTRMTKKSYEVRNWADSGYKQIDYCMSSGYTANIYFSVCDRVGNCKEFGTYVDRF